jgi:hypothetical protein
MSIYIAKQHGCISYTEFEKLMKSMTTSLTITRILISLMTRQNPGCRKRDPTGRPKDDKLKHAFRVENIK